MSTVQKEESTWWERNRKKVLVIGGIVIAIGVGVAVYAAFKNKSVLTLALKKTKNKLLSVSDKVPAMTTVASVVPKAVENRLSNEPACMEPVESNLDMGVTEKIKITVCEAFVRTLPEGWHRSAEKSEEAILMGLELADNQTIVDPFSYFRSSA